MSIIEQAKKELALINFGDEDARAMIDILEKFFNQWDSGGAVYAAAPVLMRCIAGKPLSPLTGDDSEWFDHGDGMFQNMRCSSVFKTFNAPKQNDMAWDLDGPGYRVPIHFPYSPYK